MCRYDLEDNCSYSAEECWYRHNTDRSEKEAVSIRNTNEHEVSRKLSSNFMCHNCKEEFRNKNFLMLHKKESHPETCMLCEQYVRGECTRDTHCWYMHKQSNISQVQTCHICKETFKTRNAVMMHKKRTHPEACNPCERFENGDCSRSDECWNIHEKQGFQQARSAQGLP